MFKRGIKILSLLFVLAITSSLMAEEMAIRVEPFTPTELDAVGSEETVTVFEELNHSPDYKNLLDLKNVRFNKYGLLMKFERQGSAAESKSRFGYTGFFEKTFATERRQGEDPWVTITRYKHVLFDDVLGVTCGKLKKYYGLKVRGKGLQVRKDEDAADAVTVLQLKKGEAIYFESSAKQAKRLAVNLKTLTHRSINESSSLGLGVQVSPQTGRVVASIAGTLLGKVALFSTLSKIDGKKLIPADAAMAAKVARQGAILTFWSEKNKVLNSHKEKIEIRVKREGK